MPRRSAVQMRFEKRAGRAMRLPDTDQTSFALSQGSPSSVFFLDCSDNCTDLMWQLLWVKRINWVWVLFHQNNNSDENFTLINRIRNNNQKIMQALREKKLMIDIKNLYIKWQLGYFNFKLFKLITFAWHSISDILFSCKIDAVKFILFMSEKRFGRELHFINTILSSNRSTKRCSLTVQSAATKRNVAMRWSGTDWSGTIYIR